MGWERRGNKRYYYRTRWVNGRSVKEYVGTGPEAEEAARQDAAERACVRERRERLRADLAEFLALDDQMKELCDKVEWVMLALRGYHKYRGVWRKKRKPRAEPTGDGK